MSAIRLKSNKKGGVINIFFWAMGILAILLSLGGYLGRLNLYLEFASGYKLQFLMMALCSFFYFGLTRQKVGLIVSLCCILLNLAEIVPWYFQRPIISDIESYQPLKVISYNVLWKNKQYDKAIALIDREQPDIVVFQEAQARWAKALTALKDDYPYHVGATKLELEVYSKLPLNNTEIELYGTYRGLVISDIKVGNNLIKFIGTHAYPQLHFGRRGWEIRNQHLEVGIGEYVKNLGQPAIVAGDLNVSIWSPFYRSLIETSNLHDARQGFGVVTTHSIINPDFAVLSASIDHCLVSPEIQVKNFRTSNNIGSDHLPIIADLLIPIK